MSSSRTFLLLQMTGDIEVVYLNVGILKVLRFQVMAQSNEILFWSNEVTDRVLKKQREEVRETQEIVYHSFNCPR